MTDTFTLYRFYGADDALLYVGLTRNPGRRFEKHAGDKSWWHAVARIQLEQFGNLADLREAERRAIAAEHPQYNIRMNGASKTSATHGKSEPLEDVGIHGLVGRYFHTFLDLKPDDKYATIMHGRVLEWQGRMLEQISDDLYAVETYSWWDGCATGHQLIRTDRMLDWRFYESALEMQVAMPCGEHHDSGEYCRGEREFYHELGGGLGFHFVCYGCRKRYPGFADYAPLVWRNGKPHLK